MKKEEEEKSLEFWEGFFAKQRDMELNEDDAAFLNTVVDKVGERISKIMGTEDTYTLGKMVDFNWRQRKILYQGIFHSKLNIYLC